MLIVFLTYFFLIYGKNIKSFYELKTLNHVVVKTVHKNSHTLIEYCDSVKNILILTSCFKSWLVKKH